MTGKKQFNKVPLGFYDPEQVSFPDDFEIQSQPHTYCLKDAFPNITPPPQISRVWGCYPFGDNFIVFFRSGIGRGGRVKNVSIEYGWIENGALTAGSYNSTIWTLTVQGWDIEEEPSTSFKGLSWETTKNVKAQGDRFLFDFWGGGVRQGSCCFKSIL